MKHGKEVFAIIAVALLAIAGGLFFYSSTSGDGAAVGEVQIAALEAPLSSLEGPKRSLNEWKGKVLVVNFWATWCAPCRKEIPEFIRMQRDQGAQGLQFVGIAIDEPEPVKKYVKEVGINYPILIGEIDAVELSRTLGNELGALPFTVIFDRQGRLIRKELGGVTEAKLNRIVKDLL